MPDFVFGTRLKLIRESQGLMQKDLAEKSGIRANNISNWEIGISYPSVDKLRILCRTLNCSADVLLGLVPFKLADDELKCLISYRHADEARKTAVRVLLDVEHPENSE